MDDPINQINSLLDSIPEKLYRYSAMAGREEWLKRLIVDSELYCISPAEFNDPLDCKIPFVLRGTKDKKLKYLINALRRQNPGMRTSEIKQAAKGILKDLKTEKGRAAFNERDIRNNKYGIVSLTTHPDNMLMWSYYAGSHTGIAIRFNMDVSLLAKTSEKLIPIKVRYKHEMPENNLLDIESNRNNFIATAFGVKSTAWEHEDEWRLVNPSGKGIVRIPPELIDGIVLGMNTSDEHKQLVNKWIGQRDAPTELLHIIHKRNSFDLEVVPVNSS